MGVSREESERQIAELLARDRAKADQKALDRARDASDAKGNAWRQRSYNRDMDPDEQARARDVIRKTQLAHGNPNDDRLVDGVRIVRIKAPGRRNRVDVKVPPTADDVRAVFEEIRRAEFPEVPPFDCSIAIDLYGPANEDPTKDHRITPYWGAVAWAARQAGPEPKEGFAEGARQVIANLPKAPRP